MFDTQYFPPHIFVCITSYVKLKEKLKLKKRKKLQQIILYEINWEMRKERKKILTL